MQGNVQYRDAGLFDEHRIENENRIRNLFWTVCGDYQAQMQPDMELYRENPDAAVYETVRYGAFSKYFHTDEVALYIGKKAQKSKDTDILIMLFHMCMDAAVYDRIMLERKGICDMKNAASDELQRERSTLLGKMTESESEENFDQELRAFCKIRDTDAFIRQFDQIYNRFFDPDYETENGSLQRILQLPVAKSTNTAAREALSDEQMDEILRKYIEDLKKEMLRIRRKQQKEVYRPESAQQKDWAVQECVDPQAAIKVKDYVLLNYGKSYLPVHEAAALQTKFCRRMHEGCSVHCTDGILHDPVLKNTQYRFSQMQLEKNKHHYYFNHWIVKRNIAELADILQKAMVRKADAQTGRAISGQIVPGRLWKVGRTKDEKLFDKKKPVEDQEYVLEILLDASGSQAKRQQQVAMQGYIISEALSQVHIPHRVMSFCSFWDYTILRRFRDYDDSVDKNMRIMEFRATGNNRDGLAIALSGDALSKRHEANKILIVLSDGKPCDVTTPRPGTRSVHPYQGEEAVRDTAFSVRDLRNKGIIVLGVFSGNEEDVGAEKKIYGKDFAYIRELRNFSKVVGSYLKQQIEADE